MAASEYNLNKLSLHNGATEEHFAPWMWHYIERNLMIALTKARAYTENHTSSGMLQSSSGESLRNINEGSNVEWNCRLKSYNIISKDTTKNSSFELS